MYFLNKGAAGFVLPFRLHIVYVEVNVGDDFGIADIVSSSIEQKIPLVDML